MDKWLLDRLDSLTLKLQKRGYLLTTLHVNVAGFTFISNVLSCAYGIEGGFRFFGIFMNGLVWGGWLFATQRWALANQDYPYSIKMVDRLNAEALRHRDDNWSFRLCFIWILTFLMVPAAMVDFSLGKILDGVLTVVAGISPVVQFYLNGCFFVGPGQFASKQQERELENAVGKPI